MLEDIPNPFPQVVTRNPRSSHPGGRHLGESSPSGRLIIPVGAPLGHPDASDPSAAATHDHGGPISPRITPEPGPSEVAAPKWWSNKPTVPS